MECPKIINLVGKQHDLTDCRCLISYFSKLIRDEQFWIERDSLKVHSIAESLIDGLESIKRSSKDTSCDYIKTLGLLKKTPCPHNVIFIICS